MPKFLFKANDDVISHCRCTDSPPAMSSGQLDCPWCGCGWLIACSTCKKSYTYAVVREIDTPLDELARRERTIRKLDDYVDEEGIADWVTFMTEELEPFSDGQIVVYLDGGYFSVEARDVAFTGIYATHELPVLPHFEALDEPALLDRVLGNPAYWRARERPDRNEAD